jgi:hypothetical protein
LNLVLSMRNDPTDIEELKDETRKEEKEHP